MIFLRHCLSCSYSLIALLVRLWLIDSAFWLKVDPQDELWSWLWNCWFLGQQVWNSQFFLIFIQTFHGGSCYNRRRKYVRKLSTAVPVTTAVIYKDFPRRLEQKPPWKVWCIFLRWLRHQTFHGGWNRDHHGKSLYITAVLTAVKSTTAWASTAVVNRRGRPI